MLKKRICILSFSNIAWDSRVLREINMARKYYQVSVIGYGKWNPPKDVRFFSLSKTNIFPPMKYILLILGLIHKKSFDHYFWLKQQYRKALQYLNNEKFDFIHANDWDSLPVAGKYAMTSNCRVLFDAHEYSLAKISDSFSFSKLIIPFRKYLFSNYCRKISGMITVSEGIQNLYRKEFGWDMKVILNAPKYVPSKFKKTDPKNIWLVHHGGAMPARQLEKIIDIIPFLKPEFKLAFYLMPTYPDYYQRIKNKAFSLAEERIVFNDPIPPENIVQTLNQYDIGIHFLEGNQLNHINALPNKLFDFIMAGLVVAINPLAMIKKVVVENKVGFMLEGSTSEEFAEIINSLTAEKIDEYKINALETARRINANNEMNKLHQYYETLLAGGII